MNDLFGDNVITAGAAKHKRLRESQAANADKHHHPEEKLEQLEFYKNQISGDILEVFAGEGNLTKFYKEQGSVTACTRDVTGDSFKYVYKLAAEGKKFNVIDIDGYGYPSNFMDVIWKLMRPDCLLILTYPVVGVQCVNGIYEQHYVNHWKSSRPTVGDVIGATTDYALRHWYVPKLIDVKKIKPIWRFIFNCERVKATEFTGTRNR
jgi:hypothetical protein